MYVKTPDSSTDTDAPVPELLLWRPWNALGGGRAALGRARSSLILRFSDSCSATVGIRRASPPPPERG